MTISLTEPFRAFWNHDNGRFFVSGTPFWIDWWTVWGVEGLPLSRLEPQPGCSFGRPARLGC